MSAPALADVPIRAALTYARKLGWHVLPVWPPAEAGGCSCPGAAGCPSPGKHPRTRRGLYDASDEPAIVRAMWRRWPGAGVGIRTGPESALVALDVDPGHGGAESLAALMARRGRLPLTPTARTGSGGWHVLFAWPGDGRVIRNSAAELGPGIDVRGQGGYIVAPPSRHASGGCYRWVSGRSPLEVSLAPAPAWLGAEPKRRERSAVAPGTWEGHGDGSRYGLGALRQELERLRAAPEGRRNHALNRAAFALAQLVAGGELSERSAREALAAAGQAIGLGAAEVPATIDSAFAAVESEGLVRRAPVSGT